MHVHQKPIIASAVFSVLLALCAHGTELTQAYASVLRGDYEQTQVTLNELRDQTTAADGDVARLAQWLDRFDTVVAARKDVKQRTFEWNIDQAKQALADEKVYLALTFAARSTSYSLSDDPLASAEWLDNLLADGVHAAEAHAEKDEWAKTAAYYTLMSRVRPDDERLEELRNNAYQHARIDVMYEDAAEMERRLKGVTRVMLSTTIDAINSAFYEPVDFKDFAIGALDNLRIVAQSETLHGYLDGLANSASRTFFLKRLDALEAKVKASKRFGRSEIMRLYRNDILKANRSSVELPERLLLVEFIEGGTRKIDDFTSMVWPADAIDFDKSINGGFEGVGIQLGIDELTNRLLVLTPLENSPALEAGIQAGDLIVEVNGESTRGWTTDDAVRNIMGPANTKVEMTIHRPSTGRRIPFEVNRRRITITTVRGFNRLDGGRSENWNYLADAENGIAYIRLTAFHPESAFELRRAMREAERQGMQGLILDLRGNPGGLLETAIETVSLFVERGEVVSTDGEYERRARHHVSGRAIWPDLPLVVLINEASASASEILAGALQDHDRALVLGERTYGKGSVQRVLPMRGSYARLKLTTALYYLPSGRTPHKRPDAKVWGVDPDWEVPLNPKEIRKVLDRQYDAYIIQAASDEPADRDESASDEDKSNGLDALREEAEDGEESLLTAADLELLNADPIEVADQDPQLETALLHLRVKLAADMPWPKDIAPRTVTAEPRE